MKRSKLNGTQTTSGLLIVGCFVAAIACNQQTPADDSTEAAMEAREDVQESNLEYDAEFAQAMAELCDGSPQMALYQAEAVRMG